MIIKTACTASRIIACLVLAQGACFYEHRQDDAITGIKIRFSAPIMVNLSSGEAAVIGDSSYVFYYKNCTAYKLPYESETTIISVDKTGNFLGERSAKKILYHYLVHTNTDLLGMQYDSAGDQTGRRLRIDSFAAASPVRSITVPRNYRDLYTLGDSVVNKQELVLRYASSGVISAADNDSMVLYYSERLTGIPASLSPILDRVKGKKLYRLRLVFNRKYDKAHAIDVPQREISLTMEPVDKRGHPEIPALFQKYLAQRN